MERYKLKYLKKTFNIIAYLSLKYFINTTYNIYIYIYLMKRIKSIFSEPEIPNAEINSSNPYLPFNIQLIAEPKDNESTKQENKFSVLYDSDLEFNKKNYSISKYEEKDFNPLSDLSSIGSRKSDHVKNRLSSSKSLTKKDSFFNEVENPKFANHQNNKINIKDKNHFQNNLLFAGSIAVGFQFSTKSIDNKSSFTDNSSEGNASFSAKNKTTVKEKIAQSKGTLDDSSSHSEKGFNSFDKSILKCLPFNLLRSIKDNSIIKENQVLGKESNNARFEKQDDKVKSSISPSPAETKSFDNVIEKMKEKIENKNFKEYIPKVKEVTSLNVISPSIPQFINNNTQQHALSQQQCINLFNILKSNPQSYKTIFNQILSFFTLYCCDPHGNYLVQQIMGFLSSDELCELAKLIVIHFKDFYFHNYATRVIQRLIEISKENVQKVLSSAICLFLQYLSKDHNGIHIVLKAAFHFKDSDFIYDFIINYVTELSTDKEGCCLVQKLLDKSTHNKYVRL